MLRICDKNNYVLLHNIQQKFILTNEFTFYKLKFYAKTQRFNYLTDCHVIEVFPSLNCTWKFFNGKYFFEP